jgi:hypothetical protein
MGEAKSLPSVIFPKARSIPTLNPAQNFKSEDDMVSSDEEDFSMQQEPHREPQMYFTGISGGNIESQVSIPFPYQDVLLMPEPFTGCHSQKNRLGGAVSGC